MPRGLFIALMLAGAGAMAQTPPSFLGTWKVTWDGENRPQEARLVITERGGSWKTAMWSRTNNCVGREVPVVLEEAHERDAKFKLKFSELAGCTDAEIHLAVQDDGSVAGRRGKAKLALTRE